MTRLHHPSGHAVTAPRSWWSRPTPRWPRSSSRDEQRRACEAYLAEVRKESDIDRLATDRPKTGVDLGVHATNPVNGRADPGLGGRLRAGRLRHRRDHGGARRTTSATWTSPRRSTCRSCAWSTRGEDDPEETFVATAGDGVYVNSGELDGLRRQGRRHPRDRRAAGGRGHRPGHGQLPAARLAAVPQRFWGCPIPIVHCPDVRRGAGARRPAARRAARAAGADLKPKGTSPLAAAEDWVERRLPVLRRPGHARHRHDGHLRGLVVVLPALLLAALTTDGLRPRAGPTAGCRPTCTSAASSTRSCTCCTPGSSPRCCTTWAWSTSSSRSRALLNQGQVINHGKKMSKSLGNGVDLGDQLAEFGVDAVRLTLVFAGPPEDDIDWADLSPGGSPRFLQRAWRLSGDVTCEAGTPVEGGRPRAAPGHAPHRARGRALLEAHRFNVHGRPHHGAGQRHPQGDRLRAAARPTRPCARRPRPSRSLLSLVAPYTAEEMWERLGHRADGRPGRLADGRPGPAGRGLGHRRRAGAGQAAGQAGGQPRHHRGRPGGAGAGRRRTCSAPWTADRSAR